MKLLHTSSYDLVSQEQIVDERIFVNVDRVRDHSKVFFVIHTPRSPFLMLRELYIMWPSLSYVKVVHEKIISGSNIGLFSDSILYFYPKKMAKKEK